jgi:CRP-like cAMP-binding protein
MMEALEFLRGRPLFNDLDDAALAHMAAQLKPFSVPAGTTLFREGEKSRRLFVIEEGRVGVSDRLPGDREMRLAEVGAGGMLGEMALIRGISHPGTAVALEDTSGFTVDSSSLGALSGEAAHRLAGLIGRRAIAILRREYEVLSAALGDGEDVSVVTDSELRGGAVTPHCEDALYLRGLPFFEHVPDEDIPGFVGDLERIMADRGTVLATEGDRPDGLLLVVHGAIEERVHGDGQAARVLLAGPGRCAAHLGVLDDLPSPVTTRARERCELIVIPRARIAEIMGGDHSVARRLARALYHDVVGAVEQAERPLARLAAAGAPPELLS